MNANYTHSPILPGVPEADIVSFNESGMARRAYEDTENYQVTELFINHRGALPERLLREDREHDGSAVL